MFMRPRFQLCDCVSGVADAGPSDRVLRLHSVWKKSHQREEAAPRHLCSARHAAGVLQKAQEVQFTKSCLLIPFEALWL